jgi:hypothetical protein
MNKTELNRENLAKSLVSFLSKMQTERRSVVLNVYQSGWTISFDVRTAVQKISITSASNQSNAFIVADRLLAGLEGK